MTATRIQSAAALVAAIPGDTEEIATERGALLWALRSLDAACCYPTAFDPPTTLADARALVQQAVRWTLAREAESFAALNASHDPRARDHRDTRVAVEALSSLVERRWSRLLVLVEAAGGAL